MLTLKKHWVFAKNNTSAEKTVKEYEITMLIFF